MRERRLRCNNTDRLQEMGTTTSASTPSLTPTDPLRTRIRTGTSTTSAVPPVQVTSARARTRSSVFPYRPYNASTAASAARALNGAAAIRSTDLRTTSTNRAGHVTTRIAPTSPVEASTSST